jgi:hypothetical protein
MDHQQWYPVPADNETAMVAKEAIAALPIAATAAWGAPSAAALPQSNVHWTYTVPFNGMRVSLICFHGTELNQFSTVPASYGVSFFP